MKNRGFRSSKKSSIFDRLCIFDEAIKIWTEEYEETSTSIEVAYELLSYELN